MKLKELTLAAFDEHVTVPGPDALIKSRLRPHLAVSVDNLLQDLIPDEP